MSDSKQPYTLICRRQAWQLLEEVINSVQSRDELRRFSHLVGKVYTMNLAPARMASLMSVLPELWERLRAGLLAFADFLAELDQAAQTGQ